MASNPPARLRSALHLLRVDHVLQGVALAPGTHRVALRYAPRFVWAGGGLSALGLLLTLGLVSPGGRWLDRALGRALSWALREEP